MATSSAALRRLLPVFLASVLVTATLALVADEPAQAAALQGIRGTVTLPDGTVPLGGIVKIEPVDPNVTSDETDSPIQDGTYALPTPPGQYWIRFSAGGPEGSPPAAPEWWNNSPTKGGSTPITVTAGQYFVADVQLSVGGSISGHVAQDTGDEQDTDTTVKAYQVDSGYPSGYRLVRSAQVVAETGDYTLTGLAAGTYKVYFRVYRTKREGWWKDAINVADATGITITGSSAVTGISPVNLGPLGTISGTVTRSSDGALLDNIYVQLYKFSEGNGWDSVYDLRDGTQDGRYRFDAPAGTYRIVFIPLAGNGALRTEYWNDAATVEAATDVDVTTGSTNEGYDAALEALPPIKNTGLPVVSAFSGVPYSVGGWLTGTLGSWNLTGLEYSRQWLRNGVAIPGSTTNRYFLTPADAGKRISLLVTAERGGLAPASATSKPVLIALQALKLTSTAAITGKAKVGKKLRATPPRSTPAATATFRWLRNGVAIRGATKATYKLARKDKGKKVGVRITLSRPGYATVVKVVKRSTKTR